MTDNYIPDEQFGVLSVDPFVKEGGGGGGGGGVDHTRWVAADKCKL